MKGRTRRVISIILTVLMMMALNTTAIAANADPNVEPPLDTNLSLSANRTTLNPGDNVDITVEFNLLSGVVSGYSATQVAIMLPVGLEYISTVAYIEGAPAVVTTSPVPTPTGMSLVVNFNNYGTIGAVQIVISARVAVNAAATLNVSAGLYLQPAGGVMPINPNEQRTLTLNVVVVTTPGPEPLPPTPPEFGVSRVIFDLNGGVRVGGGALLQAVPIGGAAVEPYVYRQGYIFTGWDRSFYNVQYDINVRASWISSDDAGTIPVEPPIYEFVTGQFLGDRDSFMQFNHLPLIYYANRHVASFVSVELDGMLLTSGTHYIATSGTTSGTTAIHFKASFLNTLTIGNHTFQVNFRGNLFATDSFAITRYVNTFTDVRSGDWFYKGVEAMNASELLLGVSSTHFDPHSQMTRGMVVTLLYRFAGQPSITGFRNPFPDVAMNQYYTSAVMWAAANGIVTGHENGMFAPNDLMTREQFAAVLYRYQNALGSVAMDILMGYRYSDFELIASFARGAVNKLTMQGVFRDWPTDPQARYQPLETVSRAEVATVMRLWIESIGW